MKAHGNSNEDIVMPKEIKKQITVTEYVCSNCGAVHKNKNKFYTCRITGEEICDNCKDDVYLAEIGNVVNVVNIGDISDYEVYMSDYKVPIKKEISRLPESMLEYEREDYLKVVSNLYEDFCKKMQEAHKAYLQGKIRDLI